MWHSVGLLDTSLWAASRLVPAPADAMVPKDHMVDHFSPRLFLVLLSRPIFLQEVKTKAVRWRDQEEDAMVE